MEQEILDIILNAGDAKSKSLLALREARKGNFDKSAKYLKQANTSMILAHKVQTNLIQKEISGEKKEITLLLIHAQDHLMTAMSIREIVIELVDYAKEIQIKLQYFEKEGTK